MDDVEREMRDQEQDAIDRERSQRINDRRMRRFPVQCHVCHQFISQEQAEKTHTGGQDGEFYCPDHDQEAGSS